VLQRTEAMNVVDVNTAKNIKPSLKEKNILVTNMEAAKEVVKQIRLRNLGGIIVVDFVDMKSHEDKAEVLKVLQEEFKDDKHNTKIYPFTELNLVQITRKNMANPYVIMFLIPVFIVKVQEKKYLYNIY